MATFLFSTVFGGHCFCHHSNNKGQVNTRTFTFRLLLLKEEISEKRVSILRLILGGGGGGANSPLMRTALLINGDAECSTFGQAANVISEYKIQF